MWNELIGLEVAFIHFKIVKVIHFCYGHRLMNYEGKCRNLHGHNGVAEIELNAARLDPRGMVADFGDVNQIVKEWIDRELDHKMILNKEDPLLEIMMQYEQPVFLLDCNPTAENLAHLIFDFVKSKGFPVSEVRLWETSNSFAAYRENC